MTDRCVATAVTAVTISSTTARAATTPLTYAARHRRDVSQRIGALGGRIDSLRCPSLLLSFFRSSHSFRFDAGWRRTSGESLCSSSAKLQPAIHRTVCSLFSTTTLCLQVIACVRLRRVCVVSDDDEVHRQVQRSAGVLHCRLQCAGCQPAIRVSHRPAEPEQGPRSQL